MIGIKAASAAGGAPPYVAGQTITDFANTTVGAAPNAGYTVDKTGGTGGSWDAGAGSATLSGKSRCRVKLGGAGDWVAGLAVNPSGASGLGSGATGGYYLWRSAGTLYLMDRFQNQIGAGRGSATGYGWVEYDSTDDKIRFYKNGTGTFNAGDVIETTAALGLGSTWGFDSVLNSADAIFDAHFDAW